MNLPAPIWSDNFEELGKPNGSKYWLEGDLMTAFGYASSSSWQRVLNKAIQACVSAGIPVEENFIPSQGSHKLTRFACYLMAMAADARKAEVAAAQVYLAQLADSVARLQEHVDGVERVAARDEITQGQKALVATANNHGVTCFPLFVNAGYRGMYNMDFRKLADFKGLPDGQKLMDRMGKTELAANLFRVTQTEEKIRNEQINGQVPLEDAAREVGRVVRNTMIKLSGTPPENLPLASEPIQSLKKALKNTNKRLRQIDAKAPQPRPAPPDLGQGPSETL